MTPRTHARLTLSCWLVLLWLSVVPVDKVEPAAGVPDDAYLPVVTWGHDTAEPGHSKEPHRHACGGDIAASENRWPHRHG